MSSYFIIDCQLFQTPTIDRGMGKYTLGILKSIAEYNDKFLKTTQVICVYNINEEGSDGQWKDKLDNLLPNVSWVGLDLIKGSEKTGTKELIKNNKEKITDYVNSLESDDVTYFLPAMLDDTILACFPDETCGSKNIVLFHDLIPFLFWDKYLNTKTKREQYFYRMSGLFNADLVLCNSQTTANDLARFIFIPKERLCVIRSGNPNFIGSKSTQNTDINLREKLSDTKFILCVSGDDERKNNINAVQGFAKFNQLHNGEYKLIMTSSFSKGTINTLESLSRDMVFTQNVSAPDMEWLYKNANCLLFVSRYEGLGLPIVEAIDYKLRVVASDIEVFREISEEGLIFVDPQAPIDISRGLNLAVTSAPLSEKIRKEILETWSWESTSKSFVDGVRKVTKILKNERERIAILCPHPAGISSIGKFVQEQHAVIHTKADVTYFLEESPTVATDGISYLPYVAKTHSINKFRSHYNKNQFNKIIYHIGNSDYHLSTVRFALSLPGTVVLHDTRITGLAPLLVKYGVWDKSRLSAEVRVNSLLKENKPNLEFTGSLVNSSNTVMTHSSYAAKAVKQALVDTSKPVRTHQLSMAGPSKPTRKNSPILNVAFAGIINSAKGTSILESLLTNNKLNDNLLYHVFGYSYATDVKQLVQMYKLGPVLLETDLSDIEFQNKLRDMDLLLNYRPDYHGESSKATLDAMRYGVVPIVRDIGWFSELPDEVAIKVKTANEIPEAIKFIKDNKKILGTMSAKAVEYIQRECSVEDYVKELLSE